MGGLFGRDKSGKTAEEFVPRQVMGTDGSTYPFVGEPPTDLTTLIGQWASRLDEEVASTYGLLLGIAVEARDGMTTGARHARTIISARVDQHWRIRSLSGDDRQRRGPLKELEALLGGTRPVMRAARRSKLVAGDAKDWLWSLGMILIAAGIGVASDYASHAALRTTKYTGVTVGVVFAVAVLAGLARAMSADTLPAFGHPALKRLEKAVAAVVREDNDEEANAPFRDELLRELAHERPALRGSPAARNATARS